MTLEDVKNQLGHSTIVLTSNTYGHVLEQPKRRVACMGSTGSDPVSPPWLSTWLMLSLLAMAEAAVTVALRHVGNDRRRQRGSLSEAGPDDEATSSPPATRSRPPERG